MLRSLSRWMHITRNGDHFHLSRVRLPQFSGQNGPMPVWTSVVLSPELTIHVARTDKGICRTSLAESQQVFESNLVLARRDDADGLLLEAAEQLRAYFRQTLRSLRSRWTSLGRRSSNASGTPCCRSPMEPCARTATLRSRSARRKRFAPLARRTGATPCRSSSLATV